MSHFDDETRLQPAAPNTWSGTVHPAWNIADNPNGGYLMSLAVSALRQQAPQHPDPLSVTVHYLKPGLAGQACEIDARVLRSGRALSTARATLTQEGAARLEVLAALGDLGGDASSSPATSELTIPPPDIPPPERCVGRSGAAQGVLLPILDRLEIRLHPDEAQAGKVGRAQVSGWIRFLDGREPDALAMLLFADAFPPAVFGVLGAVGWVPTLELTVHVRRRPAPGWVIGQFRTSDLADGRMIEDGWLWDSEGRLVAQSRQLALVRLRQGASSPAPST
ncbi:MAG TPA: thioesterase family protein [Burkholderiaceae bacterium]|nr:thioesterase family protein [Burkholderiaceae bacterium]